MARRADKLTRKVQRQSEAMVLGVEVFDLVGRDAVDRPAPDQAGQHLGEIVWQAERLADLGDGAARAVAGDDGG